jgi:hypothetical protein
MSSCCDNKPAEYLSAEEFLNLGTKNGEQRGILDILIALENESGKITPIDISCASSLTLELKNITTLKRLLSIDDVEEKFKNAFVAICREKNFRRTFDTLNRIFNESCKAELEVDYFKIMKGENDELI